MNHMQKLFMEWTLIGFAFGMIIGFCIGKAAAADLTLPAKPELCLTDGKNGYPGQILVVDNKCKFRLRWKTPR